MFGIPIVIFFAVMMYVSYRRGHRHLFFGAWTGLFFLSIAGTTFANLFLQTGTVFSVAIGTAVGSLVSSAAAALQR